MSLTLQIQLLDDFCLIYKDAPITTFHTPRLQSLLAYLVLHRHAPQSRARIAFQIWLDTPESKARTNLRALIHRLRHKLPDVERFLAITNQTLQWRSDAPFSLDVADFERAVESATSIAALEKAVALYAGDLLPDCYDDWIIPVRESLRLKFLETLVRLIDLLKDQKDYALAIGYAQRLLQQDALREESYRTLMRLYVLSGDRGSALRVHQDCTTALQQELDVPPSPPTRKLYESILAGELSQGELPPASLHTRASAPPHNLPPQPTPLIGRKNELAEINELLTDPNCHLLTIVGPGGIGKTRLALEMAYQNVDRFRDGVYFVSLAGIDSVQDVVSKLAHTLQLTLLGRSISQTEFLDKLSQGEPERLLVLDNFEQLLPDGVELLQEMLTHAPQVKLIVTSREVVNVRWEWRFELSELSCPEFPPSPPLDRWKAWKEIESYGAVQLFLQMVHHIRPRHPLSSQEIEDAGRICRLVAGMPLGIELAAAHVARLSCKTIAAELERNLDSLATTMRDVPARQRSLQATFDYSWTGLSAEERRAFVRLSIFRGSFTLAAAQAVTGDTLTMLISLVDKSLLRQVMPERYAIHPVLRRFAEEKLAEMPGERERTRSRCYDYYAVFLQEKTEVLYKGQEVTDTLTAINAELENLWAVWRWDLAQDEAHKFGEVLDRMWLAINWNEFFIVGDPHVTFDEHRQWLESQSSVLRMIHIDLIWLDALAEYLQDLSYTLNEEARQHFPVYVDNCRAYGKLVALPYFANVALLYYRADLLQNYGYASPPTTWDDLENVATTIQAGERAKGHTSFWGYVWQGKNYEGLTCNALEWQVSQGGGGLIEPDGLISVNNPQAIAAFERAARWVGTISPVEVTNYNEWDSWKVWLDGNAAFIHNWGVRFYDPADMLVGKDAFGVTRLPIGQAGHAATLGGSCIAIPAHTQYLQEALALTRLATKHDAQKQRALAHPFYPPTNPALYDDPEVLAVNPHFSTLKSALTQDAILRPSKITGKLYPQVSEAYFTAVHSILTGQVDAATAVADLETQLVEITGFEVGRPGRTTTNCDFNEFALS